jgi:outer membrane protein OmpA-like peptidoglycan-associated protein
VEGYSDGDTGDGEPFSARVALGANRAANVVQELVQTGLKPGIFKIIGEDDYGKSKPDQQNLSAAMKRRVEVRVFFSNDKG